VPFTVEEIRSALKSLDAVRYGAGDLQTSIERIVATTHKLFSVDGAALMLVDDQMALRNAAASDDRMKHLEELQLRHHDGPCIDAFEQKSLVGCDDLQGESRWGEFSKDAVDAGLRALLASPIPYASDAVGVVVVFSAKVHAWSPEGELALTAFTDLAALAIASGLQSADRGERADQLQIALDARVLIEQAKGVLVASEGITPREAFQKIRDEARRSRRKTAAVAAELVEAAVKHKD
jgi:GAF domain-containing protein